MAACVSGHRLVAATMADVVRMNTQADDPDDPIVGLGRHPVVGHRSLEAADDDRLGGAALGIDGRRDRRGRRGSGDRAAAARG